MSKTIVGLFRNATEAQNVKHELVNQGYSASDIQVMAKDPVNDGTAPSGGLPATATAEDTGFVGKISNFFSSLMGGEEDAKRYTQGVQNGGALLSLTVAEGQEEKAADLLEQHGARSVEAESDQKTAATAAGATTPAAMASGPAAGREMTGDVAIPVVEEQLVVGKRQVQRGGVRVYSRVVETPVEENVQLRDERIRVDRQAVNRPATEADFKGVRDGAIELTATGEEAVISKNARVVEEIAVGKQSSERTQTVKDTVRRTEVEVEQLGGEKTADGTRK